MIWADVLKRAPDLRFARDALVRRATRLLGPDGIITLGWADDAEVTTHDILLLLVFQQGLTGVQHTPTAQERWELLADGTEAGIRVTYFLADTGRVEGVRADLLEAIFNGRPLDAAISSDLGSGQVVVTQNGQVVARLSASLVAHLRGIRARSAQGSGPAHEDPAVEP